MDKIIHNEYHIPLDELKIYLHLEGRVNTIEYDYQNSKLIIKMQVEQIEL